ncbi:MAG: peptidylprolyl isomerase [Gammaproteobacteria bacterium]|nr:peptidylprolyl isomerase [Gammaproteobacteria bacterium]MCY4356157.1 peptidylprolyl isomerase [Gammaproteobacteria bacterium]
MSIYPRDPILVYLHTNHGRITVGLDSERAPISAANFLSYAKDGFYNGTIFHRVIKDFMIQGGGFDVNLAQKKTGKPIKNEANNGLSNVVGSVAMARTSDPHSATSQFFINVKDNLSLDHRNESPEGWGYAVFGEIVYGMDLVSILHKRATTTRGGHRDVPILDIIIRNTEVFEPNRSKVD